MVKTADTGNRDHFPSSCAARTLVWSLLLKSQMRAVLMVQVDNLPMLLDCERSFLLWETGSLEATLRKLGPLRNLTGRVICRYHKRQMARNLQAVVEEMGGQQTLGRAVATEHDMREAIREGFPPAVVEELMRASGLSLKELANALDLSPRSLQRRRRTGRLARYESDRLYRLARIVALAVEFLGDHERAVRWLKHPNRALGGIAPVAALDTELGSRQVENILGRIAYGGIS